VGFVVVLAPAVATAAPTAGAAENPLLSRERSFRF
jgi:hypothetical protein